MTTKIVTFWRVACGNILIVLLNVLDPSHNNLGYTQHHIIIIFSFCLRDGDAKGLEK